MLKEKQMLKEKEMLSAKGRCTKWRENMKKGYEMEP
jgi:hypothetical protein